MNTGSISSCYATGAVIVIGDSEGDQVGGLVGDNQGVVARSFASGPVEGDHDVGGLIGESNSGEIDRCYALGSSTARVDSAGGLIGNLTRGQVSDSYATGSAAAKKW